MVIEYVLDGEGYVKKDGVFKLASKDQIYICPANSSHDYYSSSEKPWTKIWMNIYGRLLPSLQKEYGITNTVIADGKPLKPIFEELRGLIYSEKTNDECQNEIIALFIRILSEIYLLGNQVTQNGEAVEMKRFLDNNTHRIVSNAELSAHIYRSPDYCVKLFKQEFGTTPYNYQLEQKISTACRMLSQTDIPVAELAEALGYSDAHYFSNLFKIKCGLSPKEYRNTHQP